MGDAYTAISDDSKTLFYNPAAMARHRGFSFYGISPYIGITDIFHVNLSIDNFKAEIKDDYKDFPDDTTEVVNRLIGKNIYTQIGIVPTIKIGNFGLSYLSELELSLSIENRTQPHMIMNYIYDRGIAMAYSFPIVGKVGEITQGHNFSVGTGIKFLYRESINEIFDIFSPEILDLIEDLEDFDDIKRTLGYSSGDATGYDLGFEYNYKRNNRITTIGLSLLDINDTRYDEITGDNQVINQKMSTNFGIAHSTKGSKYFDYSLSFDIHNITDKNSETASKLHLGMLLDFPLIDIMMGWNGGYYSTGISIDIPLFRISAGFYGVELGNSFKQKEAERFVVAFELLSYSINFDDINFFSIGN